MTTNEIIFNSIDAFAFLLWFIGCSLLALALIMLPHDGDDDVPPDASWLDKNQTARGRRLSPSL